MVKLLKKINRLPRKRKNPLLEALLTQLNWSKAGLALTLELTGGKIPTADARSRMSEIEHQGDQARFDCIDVLRRTLSIPIDREDLFRVSRSIDDILDGLRDFVRLYNMFEITGKQKELSELLIAIDDATDNLAVAVQAMMTNPREIRRAAIQAKKNKVRHLYQDALANTLNKKLSAGTLKRQELLNRLNLVADSLTQAADILSDGAIKRSH